MSLDAFDYELNNHLDDKENECLMCSKPIDKDKLYCSAVCAMDYNNY